MSDRPRNYQVPLDFDNPQLREQLKQTSKEFLHLLRQELLAQYMRHRYQLADDHD